MIQAVLDHEKIFEFFALVTENAGIEVDEKVKTVALRSLLELYFKVRSHSYARSVVDSVKAKQKTKRKALRKELKMASDPVV